MLGMWSGVNGSVDAYALVLDVCEMWWLVCGVACLSLSRNDLGAEGGAAMAGAVQHLTSLTTLEYV